jgi:hypothetical protein
VGKASRKKKRRRHGEDIVTPPISQHGMVSRLRALQVKESNQYETIRPCKHCDKVRRVEKVTGLCRFCFNEDVEKEIALHGDS